MSGASAAGGIPSAAEGGAPSSADSRPEFMEIAASAAALAAAERTGLLRLLAAEGSAPWRVSAIAERLGLSRPGLDRVLRVLESSGLVKIQPDALRGPPEAVEPSETLGLAWRGPMRAFAWEMWVHTETYLREGKPYVLSRGDSAERAQIYRKVVGDLGRVFEHAASQLATLVGPPLIEGPIVELASGSGVWGLAQARAHAPRELVLTDLEPVLDRTRQIVTEGSGDVEAVRFCPLDLKSPQLRQQLQELGPARLICGNYLHLERPDRCAAFLAALGEVLRPKADLVIVDAFPQDDEVGARQHAAYALHLAIRTGDGWPHHEDEIVSWLDAAGFDCDPVRRHKGAPRGMGALRAQRR